MLNTTKLIFIGFVLGGLAFQWSDWHLSSASKQALSLLDLSEEVLSLKHEAQDIASDLKDSLAFVSETLHQRQESVAFERVAGESLDSNSPPPPLNLRETPSLTSRRGLGDSALGKAGELYTQELTQVINQISNYTIQASLTEQELLDLLTNNYQLLTLLKGERGEKGEKGDQGSQGPAGAGITYSSPNIQNPGSFGGITYFGSKDIRTETLNITSDFTQSGGSTTLNALTVSGGTTLSGNLTVSGTTTLNSLTITNSTFTATAQSTFTKVPTLPHVFTSFPAGTSNASDGTIYINPASSIADGNLISAAVNGSIKFLVDAEGDIYGNSLVLTGTTTQGTTQITANLTVQDSTTLGDASTDTVTYVAQVSSHIIPATDNTYDLGSSSKKWRALYVNTVNGNTITTGTGTLTLGAGKTLTASNTLTFTGTDSSSVAFGTGGTVTYTSNNLSVFSATTSAQLAGVISDETGSGALVFATSPTLVTPTLGAATATTINKLTITTPTTGSTLTIADGKTLTANNTLAFSGTDSTTITFQGTDTYVGRATTDTLTNKTLTSPTINGGTHTALTSLGIRSTGTGAFDLTIANTENLTAGRTLTITTGDAARTITLSGNPTLNDWFDQSVKVAASPTFNALTVTSCTGCSPTTSAALAAAITDETGSGALVFATSPTLVTPVLGVATGTSLATSAQNIFSATAGTAPLVIRSATATDDDLRLLPQAGGAGRFAGIITTADLTADRTYTFGDASGTVYTSAAASITSAALLSSISDETGTGLLVFATSPTLTTPNIGAATATTLTQSDDHIFSADKVIRRNTSDGSDNGLITLAGGGSDTQARGGYVQVSGNEHAYGGSILSYLGNSGGTPLFDIYRSDGNIAFRLAGSDGSATFTSSNTANAWNMITPDSNGAYLIIRRTSDSNGLRLGPALAVDSDLPNRSAQASANNYAIKSSSKLWLEAADGGLFSTNVYSNTNAASANVVVLSDGHILRSTSSKRYKQDIVYLTLADVKDLVMALKPVTYRGTTESDNQRLWPGFIAEDVAAVEPILATYDDGVMGGLPSYVMYDRIPAFLVPVIQDHESRLSLVESSLGLAVDNDNDGITLSNIKDIVSISGKWSIDENGVIVAQKVKTNIVEIDDGITIKDKRNGAYYCVYFENGAMQNRTGKCDEESNTNNTNQDANDTNGSVAGENTESQSSDSSGQITEGSSDQTATAGETGLADSPDASAGPDEVVDEAVSSEPAPAEELTAEPAVEEPAPETTQPESSDTISASP
ncbi:MAG: tail fiber domain-containing protein [Candidatus Doudnabacteria bacterium]|nr:tail fiber domain-containing protein [Candidatus Doudnabacteria bacterium]